MIDSFLLLSEEEKINLLYGNREYSIELLYKLALDSLNSEKRDWIMPPLHREWIDIMKRDSKYEVVFAPRGFAKSTILKICLLDEIFANKLTFVIYASSTYTKSVEQVEGIKKILRDKRLQKLCNYSMYADSHGQVEIRFDGESTRFAKIEAVAAGGSILGKNYMGQRPQAIGVDDLEEEDQARSVMRTDRLEQWLNTSLIPTLPSIDEGKVRYIGTILSKNALSYRIKTNSNSSVGELAYTDWSIHTYAALVDSKSIWEERHSTEGLLKEQQMRPRPFAANYMNEPMDEMSGLIDKEMLQYYDDTHFDYNTIKEAYCHFDMNATKTERSDYFAGLVIGRDHSNKIYILDIVYTKPEVREQTTIIINTWIKWNLLIPLKTITIDGTSYQRTLKTWIDEEARRMGVYPQIKPVTYSKDKYTHFLQHQPLFTSRSVYLPSKNKLVKNLVDELLSFPDAPHDDLIDCFSFTADNIVNKARVGFKKQAQPQVLIKL